jgi:hypothetical protein
MSISWIYPAIGNAEANVPFQDPLFLFPKPEPDFYNSLYSIYPLSLKIEIFIILLL